MRLTMRIHTPDGENDVIVFTQGKYNDTIPAEMTNDDIRAVLKKLADYEDLEEQGLLCGWILISEQLPPKDDYILLSFSNFSLPLVGRYEENEEGGAFYIGDEDETCVSQEIYVNAWQPLPESYKERESE